MRKSAKPKKQPLTQDIESHWGWIIFSHCYTASRSFLNASVLRRYLSRPPIFHVIFLNLNIALARGSPVPRPYLYEVHIPELRLEKLSLNWFVWEILQGRWRLTNPLLSISSTIGQHQTNQMMQPPPRFCDGEAPPHCFVRREHTIRRMCLKPCSKCLDLWLSSKSLPSPRSIIDTSGCTAY